jgi:hypothetical protein
MTACHYCAGEQPTVGDYVSKHLEFGGGIRELFLAMIAMEQAVPKSTFCPVETAWPGAPVSMNFLVH